MVQSIRPTGGDDKCGMALLPITSRDLETLHSATSQPYLRTSSASLGGQVVPVDRCPVVLDQELPVGEIFSIQSGTRRPQSRATLYIYYISTIDFSSIGKPNTKRICIQNFALPFCIAFKSFLKNYRDETQLLSPSGIRPVPPGSRLTSLHFEKCLQPRKPRWADNGDGWVDIST